MSSKLAKAKASVHDIRELFEIGQEALRVLSTAGGSGYGEDQIGQVARRVGRNPETVRKARQIADPKEGYSRHELEALCKAILAQGNIAGGCVFTQSHLMKLIAVTPKRERDRFQGEVLRHGWSRKEMERRMLAAYGRRRSGGRKPRVMTDVRAYLADLEGKCIAWIQWHRAAEGVIASMPKPAGAMGVPADVRGELKRVVQGITLLRIKVSRALKRMEPSRVEQTR